MTWREHLRRYTPFLFLLIPLAHLSYWFWLCQTFYATIATGDEVSVGSIRHRGSNSVELYLVQAEIFDPRAKNPAISFDLVPVTCVIDPINIEEDHATWEQTLLLTSALKYTASDPQMYQATERALVLSMVQNKELLTYFIAQPASVDSASDFQLRKHANVYRWRVPKLGPFYERTRIEEMAAIPLFFPEAAQLTVPPGVRRERVRRNLKVSIQRLFVDIAEKPNPRIHTIAFPALAGTSRRLDSHYFLSYRQSFDTICEAIEASTVPKSIDRVYLAVWDRLPKDEERDALAAACDLYFERRFTQLALFKVPLGNELLLAAPYNILFLFLLFLTHRSLEAMNSPTSRYQWVLRALALFTGYTLLLSIAYVAAMRLLSVSFWGFLGVEAIFGLLSARAVLWLNRVAPPKPGRRPGAKQRVRYHDC